MSTIVDDVSTMTVATESNSFILKQQGHTVSTAIIGKLDSSSPFGVRSGSPLHDSAPSTAASPPALVDVDKRLSSLEQHVPFIFSITV